MKGHPDALGTPEWHVAVIYFNVGNVLVRTSRRIRPRDARRVDAHRVRLAARGLRCKAPPFVPKDCIFVGPGDGSAGFVQIEAGKAGKRGLKGSVQSP